MKLDLLIEFRISDCSSKEYIHSFGMAMPGRSLSLGNYRFGFNGFEKDDEVKGKGNSLDFGARVYDSRLGRWLSGDPLFAKYPFQSGYNFVGNSPMLNREIDGRDYSVYINHNSKTIIVKATFYTAKGDQQSHNSAVQATSFWNEQSGKYQYIIGKDEAAVAYDVTFELNVREVDVPQKEANVDRWSEKVAEKSGERQLTPDQSSNIYGVLSDVDKVFENGEEGKNTNGVTFGGNVVNVKDSRKKTETGAHEVGHTLGLGHFLKGVMTEASNDPNQSESITGGYIKNIIRNAFKGSDKTAGKGTIHETGVAPGNISKGKVAEKK